MRILKFFLIISIGTAISLGSDKDYAGKATLENAVELYSESKNDEKVFSSEEVEQLLQVVYKKIEKIVAIKNAWIATYISMGAFLGVSVMYAAILTVKYRQK